MSGIKLFQKGKSLRIEIFVERHHAERRNIARRLAIEAYEIPEHQPEPWAYGVPALCEESRQSGAGIFKPAVVERNGERHV